MDNQRLLLIIALSMVLFLIFQAWVEEQQALNPPPLAPPVQGTDQAGSAPLPTDVPAAISAAGVPNDEPAQPQTRSAELIQVLTDNYVAEIDPRGGTLVNVGLRTYPAKLDQPNSPFQLFSNNPGNLFIAESGLVAPSGSAPDHYALYSSAHPSYELADGQDHLDVVLNWQGDDGIAVAKTYRFNRGEFKIELQHTVTNNSAETWSGQQYQQFKRTPSESDQPGLFGGVYTYTGGILSTPEEPYEKIDFDTIAEHHQLKKDIALLTQTGADPVRLNQLQAELLAVKPQVTDGWIAMIQHYFLGAWVPPPKTTNTFYTVQTAPAGINRYGLGMVSDPQSVPTGATATFAGTLYVGPKLQDKLEELAPNLSRTVDYGWLFIISEPLFKLLKWIYGWVGNWGWSIIIITMMIKAVFYKLSETSYRSMANMRKMAPQMAKLKERFGDDRQKLNAAMMEMYKKEKINPLGGCLPIVVQIPVFIGLYWMLLESVELRHAPWIGWIKDLSAQDPYYILPLIMGASMFIQQRLNPTPPDPIQAKVMMALPIVFTFFFLWFPAGLVLYWVVNNILSIIQQYVITKRVEAGTGKPGKPGKPAKA